MPFFITKRKYAENTQISEFTWHRSEVALADIHTWRAVVYCYMWCTCQVISIVAWIRSDVACREIEMMLTGNPCTQPLRGVASRGVSSLYTQEYDISEPLVFCSSCNRYLCTHMLRGKLRHWLVLTTSWLQCKFSTKKIHIIQLNFFSKSNRSFIKKEIYEITSSLNFHFWRNCVQAWKFPNLQKKNSTCFFASS